MIKKFSIISLFLLIVLSCMPQKDYVITDDYFNSTSKKNESIVYAKKLTLEDKKYFAKKLDVDTTQIFNTKLYSFIKSWEGTKYVYGGTTRRGIDCSALMQELYPYVYKKELPRTAVEMSMDKRIELFKSYDNLREGDLVFFRMNEEKIISHVGIYLKNNRFFAANQFGGVEIASLKKTYWKRNFMAGGRFK